MQAFLASVDEAYILQGLKENARLRRVMWNELYTSVANDILGKQYERLRFRKKTAQTKTLLKLYEPSSRKDRLFLVFMKLPRAFLILLVRFYYGNYETMRDSRIVQHLSKNQ